MVISIYLLWWWFIYNGDLWWIYIYIYIHEIWVNYSGYDYEDIIPILSIILPISIIYDESYGEVILILVVVNGKWWFVISGKLFDL